MDPNRLEQVCAIGMVKANAVIAERKEPEERRALALAQLGRQAPVGEAGGVLRLQPRVAGAVPLAPGDPHAESAGFLVAVGDSWFDYPVHVLTKLHDDSQVSALGRMFQKVAAQGATPKAVLLSGGGDDIAGNEFGMFPTAVASSAVSGSFPGHGYGLASVKSISKNCKLAPI